MFMKWKCFYALCSSNHSIQMTCWVDCTDNTTHMFYLDIFYIMFNLYGSFCCCYREVFLWVSGQVLHYMRPVRRTGFSGSSLRSVLTTSEFWVKLSGGVRWATASLISGESWERVVQNEDVKYTREKKIQQTLPPGTEKHWQHNIGYGLELMHMETTSL